MVSILKDIPIEHIAGDAIVSAGEHLVVSPAYLSSDPEQAVDTVKQGLP